MSKATEFNYKFIKEQAGAGNWRRGYEYYLKDMVFDNLNDFAVKIQFERIWKMNEGKNRIGLTNLKEFYQKNDYKILSWVENTFFTKEYSCKFTINSSFYVRNYFFPLSARFSGKNVLLDLIAVYTVHKKPFKMDINYPFTVNKY